MRILPQIFPRDEVHAKSPAIGADFFTWLLFCRPGVDPQRMNVPQVIAPMGAMIVAILFAIHFSQE